MDIGMFPDNPEMGSLGKVPANAEIQQIVLDFPDAIINILEIGPFGIRRKTIRRMLSCIA